MSCQQLAKTCRAGRKWQICRQIWNLLVKIAPNPPPPLPPCLWLPSCLWSLLRTTRPMSLMWFLLRAPCAMKIVRMWRLIVQWLLKLLKGIPAPHLTQLPLASKFKRDKEKKLFPYQCLLSRSKSTVVRTKQEKWPKSITVKSVHCWN